MHGSVVPLSRAQMLCIWHLASGNLWHQFAFNDALVRQNTTANSPAKTGVCLADKRIVLINDKFWTMRTQGKLVGTGTAGLLFGSFDVQTEVHVQTARGQTQPKWALVVDESVSHFNCYVKCCFCRNLLDWRGSEHNDHRHPNIFVAFFKPFVFGWRMGTGAFPAECCLQFWRQVREERQPSPGRWSSSWDHFWCHKHLTYQSCQFSTFCRYLSLVINDHSIINCWVHCRHHWSLALSSLTFLSHWWLRPSVPECLYLLSPSLTCRTRVMVFRQKVVPDAT